MQKPPRTLLTETQLETLTAIDNFCHKKISYPTSTEEISLVLSNSTESPILVLNKLIKKIKQERNIIKKQFYDLHRIKGKLYKNALENIKTTIDLHPDNILQEFSKQKKSLSTQYILHENSVQQYIALLKKIHNLTERLDQKEQTLIYHSDVLDDFNYIPEPQINLSQHEKIEKTMEIIGANPHDPNNIETYHHLEDMIEQGFENTLNQLISSFQSARSNLDNFNLEYWEQQREELEQRHHQIMAKSKDIQNISSERQRIKAEKKVIDEYDKNIEAHRELSRKYKYRHHQISNFIKARAILEIESKAGEQFDKSNPKHIELANQYISSLYTTMVDAKLAPKESRIEIKYISSLDELVQHFTEQAVHGKLCQIAPPSSHFN